MQTTAGAVLPTVRRRANIDGLDIRHTDADLLEDLTGSVAALWALITAHGERMFTDIATGTIPTTVATAGDNYTTIPWSNTFEQIIGVHVLRSGRWEPLVKARFGDSPEAFGTLSPAEPTNWAIGSLPRNAATSVTAGTINIYPASTLGRTYRVLYQLESPVFTTTTNTVYLPARDWLEWVVLDMSCKVALRDEETESLMAFKAQQAEVEARVIKSLQQVTRERNASAARVRFR